MRKMLRTLAVILILLLALVGLAMILHFGQAAAARRRAEVQEEEDRRYGSPLLYNTHGGQPLFLTDPSYRQTLFFLGGFRDQAPAGVYRPWLEGIHREYRCNVIVPVYGLQSWPFEQRNREWFFQEDMREVLQIWQAYTARLPENHRLITASVSYGALPHLTIAALASRKPDALALLSPLNSSPEPRTGGPVDRWFRTQLSWGRFLIPYTQTETAQPRVSPWDIVNDRLNRAHHQKGMLNPERNSFQEYQVRRAARYLEEELAPQISGYGPKEILLIWGKRDLYFQQKGFEELADRLASGGNRVESMAVPRSGHRVLLDNGRENVRRRVEKLLRTENRKNP